MLHRLVELAKNNLGLLVIPEWRAIRLVEERHLRRLFRHLDVDCVFDVGANIGQYAHMVRRHAGFTGQLISFEPNPAVIDRLRKEAAGDSRWQVEQIALGSSPGSAEFHAYSETEYSSFRKIGSSQHAPVVESRSVSVEVQTVASYLESARRRWNFKRPFLKLDTQGFDLEIAKGAGASLREFVGLQSEIAFQTIYDGAPDWQTALRFYESSGFVLSRLVPIHELHFPQLVEMDAIMVRGDLAAPVERR
jgi:FkbM family methyltransferase